MAAITKNVFSNQFSISFLIMSCYLLKMTKILYSNLESSTRVSSALLEFGVTKTSGSVFRRHVVQNDNYSYNCVGGVIRS